MAAMRFWVLVLITACGKAAPTQQGDDDAAPDAALDAAPPCLDVGETAIEVATAPAADDYALIVTAQSATATSWGTTGNEAVVLEVLGASDRLIGHLVLHQGAVPFDYGMHAGALAAGEDVTVRVSTLSATNTVRHACVSAALTPAAQLGAAADGLVHAPIYRWPIQKSFDDIPLVVGWSQKRKSFQTVMTNEDGGTTEQCGGGASGIQAEIARWGRAADIEGSYSYGGVGARWERCTGLVDINTTPVRTEGTHPILYYGDGHNRLFENRGGYGQTCGSGSPEKPDGDFTGWNTQNPSNALADDDGKVIVIRPLPVDMDALDYAAFGGRREALIDHYAPWLYRITALELARETKIDNSKTFGMARYLYVDVRVSDVNGTGDSYCSLTVSGGFKLHAITSSGTDIVGPQITGAYASNGAHDWKRVAIALPSGVAASDIAKFRFDAYDGDGIYLTGIGDAFIPKPDGENGATLDYVRQGDKALAYYVDDDQSSCTGGVNAAGPGGTAYQCSGSFVDVNR